MTIARKPPSKKEVKVQDFINRGRAAQKAVDDILATVQLSIQLPKDLAEWLSLEAKKRVYSRRTYIGIILSDHRKQVEKGLI